MNDTFNTNGIAKRPHCIHSTDVFLFGNFARGGKRVFQFGEGLRDEWFCICRAGCVCEQDALPCRCAWDRTIQLAQLHLRGVGSVDGVGDCVITRARFGLPHFYVAENGNELGRWSGACALCQKRESAGRERGTFKVCAALRLNFAGQYAELVGRVGRARVVPTTVPADENVERALRVHFYLLKIGIGLCRAHFVLRELERLHQLLRRLVGVLRRGFGNGHGGVGGNGCLCCARERRACGSRRWCRGRRKRCWRVRVLRGRALREQEDDENKTAAQDGACMQVKHFLFHVRYAARTEIVP